MIVSRPMTVGMVCRVFLPLVWAETHVAGPKALAAGVDERTVCEREALQVSTPDVLTVAGNAKPVAFARHVKDTLRCRMGPLALTVE